MEREGKKRPSRSRGGVTIEKGLVPTFAQCAVEGMSVPLPLGKREGGPETRYVRGSVGWGEVKLEAWGPLGISVLF